jgi:hypothetical protein
MRKIIGTLTLLILTGCVSTARLQSLRDEFNRTVPTCSTEAECSAKWDAAQLWVASYIPRRIATATNVLIQTYGSANTDTAATVMKQPSTTSGTYRLVITTYCGNIFACFPDSWQSALAFNRAIGSVPVPERKATP